MSRLANRVALVVEDSTMQRMHLVALLKSIDFETVLEASDGADALHVLEK